TDSVENYAFALEVAQAHCVSFQLVARNPDGGGSALSDCRAALLSKHTGDSWPGTQLHGGVALIRQYRLDDAGIRFLRTHSHFKDWCEPNPEDLAFYRADGSWLLGAIGHEGDVFLQLTEEEEVAIRKAYPMFASSLQLEEEFE